MSQLFLDILDEQRQTLLASFKRFKDRFYLAGGTALALQLGHRDSVDFDFFTPIDDIIEEPISFKHDRRVDLSAVFAFLKDRVKKHQSGR